MTQLKRRFRTQRGGKPTEAKPYSFCAFLLLLAFAPAVFAGDDVAADVVKLRLSVDALSVELKDQRESTRAELLGLAAEKRDLFRQIRLEEVRRQTLALLEQERSAAASGVDAQVQQWVDAIRASVSMARDMLTTSSPVHQRERLAALLQVEGELDRAAPDPVAALEKLWRFLEEEEALSREVALDRQIFTVGETGQLFDVVHLGLSVMYARSTEGELFMVQAGPEHPILTPLVSPESQALIRDVFDAVGRGKREMPILLPQAALTPPKNGSPQ